MLTAGAAAVVGLIVGLIARSADPQALAANHYAPAVRHIWSCCPTPPTRP